MKCITKIYSTIVPLFLDNIDTDQIIPARFLTATDKKDFGKNLFVDLRYGANKEIIPNFILNRPEFKFSEILLVGENFGCGSSREHAPWALLGHGFKAVVAISFAEIFKNNALKNGLLPITLSRKTIEKINGEIKDNPKIKMQIYLDKQTVIWQGDEYFFEINPFAKKCLLQGLDDIGYTLSFTKEIENYEKKIY
ncbi:3-isopropylmalate dehydratase small subunit [Patescibacteria group bacterium]|nr:3-isopropylmalate dehydratase small subunit [Patescibacteria group bacterium]